MNIKLKPFRIPNFVLPEMIANSLQDRPDSITTIPLTYVDENELSQMCDEFRLGVFRKAEKQDPRSATGDTQGTGEGER